MPRAHPQPQYLLDTSGLLAWIPWENGQRGSDGAARFVDGKWIRLDASAGWPTRIVHLIPLLDGSVLQLALADDEQTVSLTTGVLDSVVAAGIDEAKVSELVKQLSDNEPATRDAAHAELSRTGRRFGRCWKSCTMRSRLKGESASSSCFAQSDPMLGRMILHEGRAVVAAVR